MGIAISQKRVMTWFGAAAVLLAVLSTAGQLYRFTLNEGAERYLTQAVSLDEEANLPTFYSVAVWLACSLLLLLVGRAKKEAGDTFRGHWTALGIVFFVLAIDEMLALHEKTITPLRGVFGAGGFFSYAWTIPAIVLVLALFFLFLRFLLHLPRKTRVLFLLSGGLFVAGAIGLETVGGKIAVDRGETSLLYAMVAGAEEILEMAGLLVFLSALLAYVRDHLGELKLKVVR